MKKAAPLSILIGFADAIPAPEVIFSLTAAGHRIRVFGRAPGNQGAAAILTRLPVGEIIPITAPEEDAAAARADLLAILTGPEAPDAVYGLDDIGLWLVDAVAAEIEDADKTPPLILSERGDRAAIALNKIRQIEAARSAGISVPETLIAEGLEDLRALPRLPAIIKPAMAVAIEDGKLTKGRTRYVLEAEELAGITEDEVSFPALVQPLIHGVGEGVFGFVTDDGVINWSGHRRVRMMNPHGSGSSACRTHAPDADMRDAVAAMMTGMGWRGPFMVELLRHEDGTAWFMELNGRLWGSLALARRAGFDYPAWTVAAAIRPETPLPRINSPEKPLLVRHLGRDLMHLLFVLRGPKSAFHRQRWPRLLTSLIGVLTPTRARNLYNHDPRFRSFLWADTWAFLKAQIARARKR